MEKRFFYSTNIQEQFIELDADESRHLSKVLRASVGDQVYCLDGLGNVFQCEVSSLGKSVTLEVTHQEFHENRPRLHLGIAPTKKAEKMEWMLEKLTELGLHSISFLKTQHGEKHRLKSDRLEKKALSAMKQSGQHWLPNIQLDLPFKDWINAAESANKWIAHCHEEKNKEDFKSREGDVYVAIGPEGDFSPNEVEFAIQNGFKGLHLGDSRLRTETAGLAVGVLANLV